MKTQDYRDYIEQRIVARQAAAIAAKAAAADAANADEKTKLLADESEHNHAVRFLATMQSDDVYSALASQRVSVEALAAIESDAKSLHKLALLCRAIKQRVKLSMSDDDALAQAVYYLSATDYAEIDADTLRKQIMSARSKYTEAHTTTRQSAMILNLLKRLNCATVERRDNVNYYKFDTDSAMLKAIERTMQ